MSSKADITRAKPRLAYSCRCGWLDLGHMDAKSYRKYESASSLWDQISNETGKTSQLDASGFKVVYQQTHAKKKLGMTIRDGVKKEYFVKKGLTTRDKESVALAIFMEVSHGFESMQSNWLYSQMTDSGYSVEDLVSNLIGFYLTVRPGLDFRKICQLVSPSASVKIWDTYGSVGSHKNKKFLPKLFPCDECLTKDKKGSKAGDHAHGPYSVSIAKDGKINVRSGDWLSKYSAAIHGGDVTQVNEYGRMVGGKLQPIIDVDRIDAGEDIYHIPTHEASQVQGLDKPKIGALPPEFSDIKPAKKGTLLRMWGVTDEQGELPPEPYSGPQFKL